jgi:hypothetical protein
MKKLILSLLASASVLWGGMYLIANATPITPTYGGGLGTSTLPAFGSIPCGFTSSQYAILGVGSNGQVPVASSTAPCGISWQAQSGGGSTTSTITINGTSSNSFQFIGDGITETSTVNGTTTTFFVIKSGIIQGLVSATGTKNAIPYFTGATTLSSTNGTYASSTGQWVIGAAAPYTQQTSSEAVNLVGGASGVLVSDTGENSGDAVASTGTLDIYCVHCTTGSNILVIRDNNGAILKIQDGEAVVFSAGLTAEGVTVGTSGLHCGSFGIQDTNSQFECIALENGNGVMAFNDGSSGSKNQFDWFPNVNNPAFVSMTTSSLSINAAINEGTQVSTSTLYVSGDEAIAGASGSSTLRLGTLSSPQSGCIEMYDHTNSSTLWYAYPNNGVFVNTTTNPGWCE